MKYGHVTWPEGEPHLAKSTHNRAVWMWRMFGIPALSEAMRGRRMCDAWPYWNRAGETPFTVAESCERWRGRRA